MNRQKQKIAKRVRRHTRVRAKVSGTAKRPRLAVFRANQHIYAQLINDATGKTLAASSSLAIVAGKTNKTDIATKVGEDIAKKAADLKITEVVFDRGGFLYHGRVKALAEAARTAGLKF